MARIALALFFVIAAPIFALGGFDVLANASGFAPGQGVEVVGYGLMAFAPLALALAGLLAFAPSAPRAAA